MSTKLETIQKVYNQSDKPFRFTLSEPSNPSLIIHHAPDGWQDAETTYTRDRTWGSVFRNTSTNELTFYKEARAFLKNCYENTGIDCNATMTVEKLNTTSWTYESYPAAGKFDFSTYQIDEISVKIQMVDTSFKEKVISRASTEVDINSLTSIEGYEFSAFPITEITMPDTSVILNGTFQDEGTSANKTNSPHVVPVEVVSSDFSETQTPVDTVNTKVGSFFNTSIQPRNVVITGSILADMFFASGTGEYTFVIVHLDSSEVVKSSTTIKTDSSGVSPLVINFSIPSTALTLDAGDSVALQCTFTSGDTGTDRILYATIVLEIDETYTGTPEKDVIGMLDYETFLRISQIYTDQDSIDGTGQPNPFYSDFFGRTDTPLTTYGADGEMGFVTKGIYFRGSEGISNTIPLTLKDFFESKSAQHRLGLSVEQISGIWKVRVEELDHYFPAAVVLDLSSVLRSQDIQKHVIPDMFYSSVEIGYNKFLYESNAGLLEFNTKSKWSTVIKAVETKFNKISKYRADGQGIRFILVAPNHLDDNDVSDYDPTADVKGDSDIFMVDCVRDGGDIIARTNEGFTSVEGAVYASSSFNLKWSPGRMLKAWGSDIYAGLIKSLNSIVKWQTGEKNSTLKSTLTTEDSTSDVDEDADITAGGEYTGSPTTLVHIGLTESRWLNEKYIVKAPLTLTQLKAIDATPNGLIKLGDATYNNDGIEVTPAKYGWLLKLKTTNKDGMAELEVLRYNVNVVTPT